MVCVRELYFFETVELDVLVLDVCASFIKYLSIYLSSGPNSSAVLANARRR